MKKNIFGLAAIILAIGFSAFNIKPSNTTMYYHGPDFTHDNVVIKTNWNTTSFGCTPGTAKACQVIVPDNIVSSGSFVSTVSLEATAGSPSALTDVKNSGTSVNPSITNKVN